MNMDRLLESVKKHEGYRNKVYLDTLGKRTVGVGHLCVEDFWEDDKEYCNPDNAFHMFLNLETPVLPS